MLEPLEDLGDLVGSRARLRERARERVLALEAVEPEREHDPQVDRPFVAGTGEPWLRLSRV